MSPGESGAGRVEWGFWCGISGCGKILEGKELVVEGDFGMVCFYLK